MSLSRALLSAILLAPIASNVPGQDQTDVDDRKVYERVITQVVELKRDLHVMRQTRSICQPGTEPATPPGCFRPNSERFVQFSQAKLLEYFPELTAEVAAALTDALMQHTRDHVVPDLGSIGVTMSDRDDLTLANRDRSTPYKQYVMFLRPGYSAGHAIVMANYTCGNLCGSSWLVLLRADGDTWQIASVRLMSVS